MPAILAGLSAGLMAVLKALWPFKSFEIDERAIITRLGKPITVNDQPKVFGPGATLLIPGFHRARRCRIWPQVQPWESKPVLLRDGSTFRVGMALTYKITGVYQALFHIDNLAEKLDVTCHAQLRGLFAQLNQVEAVDPLGLADQLQAKLSGLLEEWGVEVVLIEIHTLEPEGVTADLMLSGARQRMVDDLTRDGWTREEALAVVRGNVILAPSGISGHVSNVHDLVRSNGHGHNGNGKVAVAT